MFLTSRLSAFSVRNCTSRNTTSRAMSLFSSGHVLSGAHWRYRILEPIQGDQSHFSTVFKAEVLADDAVSSAPTWAVIKAAPPGNERAMKNLKCEKGIYRLPGLSSAACYRQMYDEIDDNTVALEWLDTTLQNVKYQPNMHIYSLIKASMKSALASAAVLDSHDYVNPDFKPANILISNFGTNHLTVKVGDLGLVRPCHTKIHAQPWSMRAPEVFLGKSCYGPSQVWAIAAMVLVWMKRKLLGSSDAPHPILAKPWSMAKLRRLFPDWQFPNADQITTHELKAAIQISERESREEEVLLEISPLPEEMRKMEIPKQLRDLLSFMLVTDPEARPSASDVLASSEFHAFEQSADT